MDKAKQMIYNEIRATASELVENALYSVQEEILNTYEVGYCEPNEIDLDFYDYDRLADKITESVIDVILK